MFCTSQRISVAARFFLLSLIVVLSACGKSPSVNPSADSSANSVVKVFASPDDAGNELLAAAKSGDQNALLAILGKESKEIIFSGDGVQDKAAADAFVGGYGMMHRWRKMPDQAQILLIGPDNFAFPIPLKKNSAGQWYFDSVAGKDEILSRRIGSNELAVIDICGALVDAQAEYFSQPHDGEKKKQFAPKFISDSGRQNGLYWESSEGQPRSPLGPLAAFATSEGYSVKPNSRVPFHGYYFRMLNSQGRLAPGGARDYIVDGKLTGGFAFVAYPAEYGNSGVMTFIINQDGVLLQKDLGKKTTELATAMTEFNPDNDWRLVMR
jgi:hypothetical protein